MTFIMYECKTSSVRELIKDEKKNCITLLLLYRVSSKFMRKVKIVNSLHSIIFSQQEIRIRLPFIYLYNYYTGKSVVIIQFFVYSCKS